MHVRYLGIEYEDPMLPDEVWEDYIRLFPDRPFLPRVQLINMRTYSVQWLRFLLRSSTPAENQPSASASTLRHLYIYSDQATHGFSSEEGEGLARDLVAFQHSNIKLGGGIEIFKKIHPLPIRRCKLFMFAGLDFQVSIVDLFALPLLETVDSPSHGLRRLEVSHFLAGLPGLFERVAKMRVLEHLKIVILDDSGLLGVEDKNESVQHLLGSLEIEGSWWHLSPAINLCASPSATTQLRTFRLYYYQIDREVAGAKVAQVLDLPTGIVSPDHLETLTIELADDRKYKSWYPKGPRLTNNALQPLLRYRKMVKLHLDLPCSIWPDIEFLRAIAAVMGETLSHLVIRAITDRPDGLFKPVLTVDDLATTAGVILPRLETIGLDVPWHETPSSIEGNFLVASSLLRTLHVGTKRTLLGQESSTVAKFLKEHFPGLQYLYRHREVHPENDGWQHVMTANGYGGGYYGPGSEDRWGCWGC